MPQPRSRKANPAAPRLALYRGQDLPARAAERRRRLIEAAIQLYGTQGYHETKVREICGQAGLTERYFYESFANSEQLLLAAYQAAVEGVLAKLQAAIASAPPSVDGRMRAALTTYLAEAARDPAITRLTLVEPRTVSRAADAAYRATQARIADMIAEVLASAGPSQPRHGLSAVLLTRAIAGAFNSFALDWYDSGFATPLDEMIRTALAVFAAAAGLWEAPPAP